MSGMIRPAPRPIIRFVTENFAMMPSDFRGQIPFREAFGLVLTAHRETEIGVPKQRRPSRMKVSRCAVNKSIGSNGKRPGTNVPTPDAIVNVMNERLNVAALTSKVVVSARNAFHVDRYIASPNPPTIAETYNKRMFPVMPGMTMTKLARSAPMSIMCLRPYRSESTANGILKTTVVNPNVVRRPPRMVTDIPSRGRKTVMATW